MYKSGLFKLITLLLLVTFIASVGLVGCKTPAKEEAKEETATTEAAATEEETAPPQEEWSYEKVSKELGLEGTTITVVHVSGEFFDQISRELAPKFTEMTGIKVIIEDLAAGPLHDKILVDWGAGSGYDVIAYSNWQAYEFLPMKNFEPLEKYLEDPKLLDPNFDFADFIPKLVDSWCRWSDEPAGTPYFTKTDGTLYAIPGPHSGSVIMAYRKDLLEQKGIEVPKTWDEYLEAAKALNNPDEEVYGTTLHGLANEHLPLNDFMPRFFSFGGEFFTGSKEDGTLKANLNSPEAVKALQNMVDLTPYAPPGYLESAIGQTIDQFMTGKTALTINWSVVTGIFESDDSQVKGKVAYVAVPGSSIDVPGSSIEGGWGMGINKFSKNKEAAWLWIEYIKGKEAEKYGTLKYGLDPVRYSTFKDPDVVEKYPHYPEILKSLENARLGPINIAQLWELLDIASRNFQKALAGEVSAEEATKVANDGWMEVLIREGYFKE
ncbi:MAG: sugar ABC transporter substrate-binding protein [Actinobacteria bacterium]|nr:sugar ABC transporter substrate-binding protein [Actinomycetota bacterium]